MFITLQEIIDILVMTAVIGFIFKDVFPRKPHAEYDPLKYYKKPPMWENFKFAIMVAAPAIIIHELFHKFTAMAFGLNATFHAAYAFLALGLVLKVLNFPFIFFVPAYVSIPLTSAGWQYSLIAFAGPFANLLMWLIPYFLLKLGKIPKKYHLLALLTAKINMFLFIFNMLPIPGFDGSKVFAGLFNISL